MTTAEGAYRALVVNNNDPEGRWRIQFQSPQLMGQATSGWALPIPASATSSPPVGAQVMIAFEGGDLSHPLYYASDGSGAAQDAADAAAAAAAVADGKAVAAAAAAVVADGKAVSAASAAAVADGKAVVADGKAVAAASAAVVADNKAVVADGKAVVADGKAGAAAAAASTADNKAVVADGKAVTADGKAVAAAAAAAVADGKAVVADGKAVAADAKAGTALTSANGRNSTITLSSAATGTTNPKTGLPLVKDDLWRQTDGTPENNVKAEWRWDPAATPKWVPVTLVSNLSTGWRNVLANTNGGAAMWGGTCLARRYGDTVEVQASVTLRAGASFIGTARSETGLLFMPFGFRPAVDAFMSLGTCNTSGGLGWTTWDRTNNRIRVSGTTVTGNWEAGNVAHFHCIYGTRDAYVPIIGVSP